MNTHVKAGDYAFLRGLDKSPEFNGRVVKVLNWNAWHGQWQIEPQFDHPLFHGIERHFCADEHLLPISGEPIDEETSEELTA